MSVVRAARGALPAAALLTVLALPAGAQAASTLSVTGTAPSKTLTFTASDGLDHRTWPAVHANGHLYIEDDTGAIVVGGSGCTVVDSETVDCGAAGDYARVVFGFGAGDDLMAASGDLPIPITVDGGDGDDDLSGGSRGDQLDGGPGDDSVYGEGGADTVLGGDGDDEISGGLGADTIDGGDGRDFVGAWDFGGAEAGTVHCGAGIDSVDFDYGVDLVDADCENRPPHLDAPPVISGELAVGSTLSRSTPPTSGGAVSEAYTYWRRCDAAGFSCEDIDGAEDPEYTITADDVGSRIAVDFLVANDAGYDGLESELTEVVSLPALPAPLPVAPPAPRAVLPVGTPVVSAFGVGGVPTVKLRGSTATVDTGRTVTCPAGADACRLRVTARVSHRSAVAGTALVRLGAGKSAKVTMRLTGKTTRLLRQRKRLTLAVKAVLDRGRSLHATSSFAVTVKAPKRR